MFSKCDIEYLCIGLSKNKYKICYDAVSILILSFQYLYTVIIKQAVLVKKIT